MNDYQPQVIAGPEIWDVCGKEITKEIQNAPALDNKILFKVLKAVRNYKAYHIEKALKYLLSKIDIAFNSGNFMIVDDYLGGSGIYIMITSQSITFLYSDKDTTISNDSILKYKKEIESTIAKLRGFSHVHIAVIDKSKENDTSHRVDLRIEISPNFDTDYIYNKEAE